MRSDHTAQGFFQLGLENIQEQSRAHPGLGVSLPGCPHSGQISPYTQPKHLVAAYVCHPLASCWSLQHKAWLWKLPRAAATCPEAVSSPGWRGPFLSLPSRGRCSRSAILLALCWAPCSWCRRVDTEWFLWIKIGAGSLVIVSLPPCCPCGCFSVNVDPKRRTLHGSTLVLVWE